MKKFIVTIAVIFVFTLSVSEAFACSCIIENKPFKTQVKDAYKGSEAVFTAEVIEINRVEANNFAVKLKVEKSWKGISSNEITITTAQDSAMCGYTFEVGKKYIVYAYGEKEKLGTSNCSRTSLADSNKDAKVLNKLNKPKSFPK